MRWQALLLAVLGVLHADPSGAQEAVPLTFVGGSDGYKLSRFTPDFQELFEILPSNGKAVQRASLSIPPLRAPSVNPAPVSLSVDGKPFNDGSAIRIPPEGIHLTVSAMLAAAAVYQTTMKVLMPDHKPLLVPLQITRVLQQLPLEFRDLDTVIVETGQAATATFGLRETSGLAVTVNPPALVPLVRLENNKRLSASSGTVTQTLSLAPPGGVVKDAQAFGAGEIKTYALGFQGPDEAGEYSGTIRVGAANRPDVERQFSVLVHDPAIYAVLWILFGILLAQLFRWFFQTWQPSVQRSQRALALLDRLGRISATPGVDDEALQVARSMEQRVQVAYQQIRIGQGEASDAVLTEVERKLPLLELWYEALKRVAALGGSPIAPAIRETVMGARAVLVDPDATQNAVTAAANTLRAVPEAIRHAQRADVVKARDALAAALQKNPGGTGHLPAVQAVVARVQQLVDDADRQIHQEDFEHARALIAEARQEYVVVLADEMLNKISGATPVGYTAGEWAPLADEIARLLRLATHDIDADRAWSEYDAARRLYFRDAIGGLSRERGDIGRQVAAIKQKNANSPVAAAAEGELTAADLAIKQAQDDATGDLDAAFQSISTADLRLRQAGATVTGGGAVMGGLVQTFLQFFDARTVPALAPGVPPQAVAPIPAPQVQVLQGALAVSSKRWDAVISVLIAIVAVLLGMKALWLGNHTWGGPQDYIIASLWGMGLHGFSFDGVSGLAKRFTSS